MSYYEDDRDDTWVETAEAAGWVSEDVVEELRTLLKHFSSPDPFPRPESRNDAIMIMLDHKLNPPSDPTKPEDPTVFWAKHMLKDIL